MKRFTSIFLIALLANVAVGQVNDSPQVADAEKLLASVQKICPVTGEALGSMGAPIKVMTSEHEELFLCCKGCVGKPMKAQSWQTVQANIRAAQDKCPVMDKQLPAEAKSVIVKGRRVYICCPGCDKKLAADPDTYLARVDEMIVSKLDVQNRDGHADHRAGSHTKIK